MFSGDPRESADLLMGQALALEVDGLHPLLHPGVRMMEPLVVEGVEVRGGEVDVDHHRGRVGFRVPYSMQEPASLGGAPGHDNPQLSAA